MRCRPTALLLLAALPLSAAPIPVPPGAYELLEGVRRTYAGLGSYRDAGELERTVRAGGLEGTTRFVLDTAAARAVSEDGATAGDAFRFRLATTGAESEERVLWRDGDEALLYDGRLGQYRPVSSLAAALAHDFGEAGFEALVVPMLLAGSAEALSDPEAAAVEGPDDCGGGSCWVLSLSRMGGTIESSLWIDRESLLIRRVEVELHPASVVFGSADRTVTLRVRHDVADAGGDPLPREQPAFQPPADARRVTGWQPAEEETAGAEDLDPALGFYDEITVELFTVTARIVDRRGDPLPDLLPADVVVRAGRRELPVVALDWVSSEPAVGADATAAGSGADYPLHRRGRRYEFEAGPAGQLVVLFVQADFIPSVARGHLKLLPALDELLAALPAEDRVAVVSFYGHLKLWHDFTRDRGEIADALRRAVRPGAEPLAPRATAPHVRRRSLRERVSMVEHFDFREAPRAASPERALELVAEALAPLAGEKVVIWLGWALGELQGRAGVHMTADYRPALRALDAARATVFVLDVSQADWHALEAGLRTVASDTGGTYAKTHQFGAQAVHRLARRIAGHYVLTVDRSGLPDARGKLRIELRQRNGTVHFKPIVVK